MTQSDTDEAISFADLALRPELLRRAHRRSATRSPRRSSARRSRRCSTGATCSARRPPAPARRRRSRCRCCSGCRPATGGVEPAALVLVPTRELADAGVRGVPPLRPGPGHPGAADLRRAADRPAAAGAASAASTWWSPPRAGRSTTSAAARCSSARWRTVVLDEADEMLDMGFAEDIEAILAGDAGGAPDGAVLGDHAAADRRASPAGTCATRSGSQIGRQSRRAGRGAAGAAERLHRGAGAQAGGAGPGARRRVADGGDRLLPHPRARSTSSPRRSTGAATAPRRCTAG